MVPETEARRAARERPPGTPVMYQEWHRLLFLHWQVPVETLRPLIPAEIEIDTFDGKAWISVTPLTIYNVRPTYLPPVPYFSWLFELNVRTYVHVDGVPGVWFFSLDANNMLAVWGARTFFSLPYFNARIMCETDAADVRFWSARTDAKAEFTASWTIGEDLPAAEPGSLDFFLVERYCLYAAENDRIYRCRIHHKPWPLQHALDLKGLRYGVVEADGIPMPADEPKLHCGGPVFVDVWAPERVR
jgi:uncharacterized protein YqjF (DUF2071 family)